MNLHVSLARVAAGRRRGQIRAVFDRVHARVIEELPSYPGADLDLPPLKPHARFAPRVAGLRYAPLHEMIHRGQVATDPPDARHEADLVNPRRPVRIL